MNQFEQTLEQLKERIERAEKLERLYQVPEFKELILEGYLKKEPERLAEVMGGFAANGLIHGLIGVGHSDRIEYMEKLRKDCLRATESVSNFHTYLKVIFAIGDNAIDELKAHEEAQAAEISEQESDA